MGSRNLLGNGLIRPFRRDEKNDFASASGETLLQSCIGQVLGTKAAGEGAQGELPWRPSFGSKLHLLRHRKGFYTRDLARVYATESLRRWEPRVQVVSAETSYSEQTRTTTAKVTFVPAAESTASNRVLDASTIDVPV